MPSLSSLLRLRLQRHLYCSNAVKKWNVKQVYKSNFPECLENLKNCISDADFIAVSLQKSGSFSSSWHRFLSFDTPNIAYFKAKYEAEKFQPLQFAVCPFSIRASDVIAHPFNFHLFPKDELNIGMPAYSFSCQTSYLTSMARDGFDFNACIHDGLSYLSRAQESVAKVRLGSPKPSTCLMKSSSTLTVADTLFVERVRSRIKHWKEACDSETKTNEALLRSLKKLILGNEQYGSRPCINIDICSERQVQLVLELLGEFSDDLFSLIIPTKGGGSQAVRVIYTSSKEDKDLFKREIQNLEEEENKRLRGFREVIEMISASQKPVVSYNSLRDFTFIHSKFLATLPPTIEEFAYSLDLVFPTVVDVCHLMREIGPLTKLTNMGAAQSYLKNHYFAPVNMRIADQGTEGKNHGDDVLKLCHLFAKICSILKIDASGVQPGDKQLSPALEKYVKVFHTRSTSLEESMNGDVRVWTKNSRRVSCENLVFLWGLRGDMTARLLKTLLQGSHNVFRKEFDVRLVDKSCAIVVFWQPDLSSTFLDAMNNNTVSGSLKEMISVGLRGAGYETYMKVCRLGLWETDLAGSLDKALADTNFPLESGSETGSSEIHWSIDFFDQFK